METTVLNRRRMLTGMAGMASAAMTAPAMSAAPKPRNVVFILSDDHRYDAMGFLNAQPWLETPQLDRLANEGAYFKNAFVTTALCSPSRASILTGVYAHRHRVVDNNTAIPAGTPSSPHLQKAGYKTAFIGKWHMGAETDEPKPGFDQWVSFRGQGTYLPNPNGLNVDGRKVPQKGYITDELTDYALDWLRTVPQEQPYFLYLSHKAVHADFVPATRHKGRYKDAKFVYPPTMAPEGEMAQHRPMWVQNQRNSWHGVDFPYHSTLDIADYYRRYAETLMAVDESVGRVDGLRHRGELDSTLVVYMGDNGFAFGEHGLIDKRTAYEESMRVPHAGALSGAFRRRADGHAGRRQHRHHAHRARGRRRSQRRAGLDGRSWLPLAQGKPTQWRDDLLYEYYWERNFPQTPTMHALRGDATSSSAIRASGTSMNSTTCRKTPPRAGILSSKRIFSRSSKPCGSGCSI